MFKKLKDKIAEEVKQTPIRLPTSVQQLSQQISAFSRESLGVTESKRSTSNQFSIAEEDTYDHQDSQFQNVSLIDIDEPGPSISKTSTPVPKRTRKSSQGSVGSMDRDFTLFGSSYDSSYTPYHFQSDMESVASGMSEGTGTYSSVNKEQLVHALQRAKTRYHKYKGRYQDLAAYYKDLEKEREKLKNVLTETQDKALKRISDLKEQCQLEQKAKAHLEENLRADLEEKDHIISVLQSKIKLLQSKSRETSQDNLIDIMHGTGETRFTTVDSDLSPREQEMQERIKRYEELLSKCKEKIKSDKEKIDQMRKDLEAANAKLLGSEAEVEKIKESHSSELNQLTDSLNIAREEILALRKREESAMIASAETKQQVHNELLKLEEEMQRVKTKLGTTLTEKETLVGKVATFEKEITSLKKEYVEKTDQLSTELKNSAVKAEEEKQKLVDELSRGKAEAIKILKEQLEKESNVRWEAVLQERLREAENKLKEEVTKIDEMWTKRFQELEESKKLALEAYNMECGAKLGQEGEEKERLKIEISELKSKILEIEAARDAAKERWEEAKREWVNQVEENRNRHIKEIEEMTKEHEAKVETLLKSKESSVELMIEEISSKHRKEVENLQQQLEEALEVSANASEAYRCEMEAARVENERLLNEKDAQIQQLSEELSDSIQKLKEISAKLEESCVLVKNKDEQISGLAAVLDELKKKEELLMSAKCELEHSRGEAVNQLAFLESKVKTLEEQLGIKDKECKDLTGKAEAALTDYNHKADKNKKEFDSLQKEIKELREELVRKESEKEENENELDRLKKVDKEQCEKITAYETQIKEKAEAIDNLQTDLKTLQNDLEKKSRSIEDDKKRFVELQKALEENEKQLLVEVDSLKERLIDVEGERDKGIQELKKRTSDLEARAKDIQNLEAMLANKNIGLTEVESQLRSSYEEKLAAEAKNKAELTLELENLKKEASKAGKLLEVNKKMQERLKEKETVLKNLMKEKNQLESDLDQLKKVSINDKENYESERAALEKESEELHKKLASANEALKQTEDKLLSQLEILRNDLTVKSEQESSLSQKLASSCKELEISNENCLKLEKSLSQVSADLEEAHKLYQQTKSELLLKSEAEQALLGKVVAAEQNLNELKQRCEEAVEAKLNLEGKIRSFEEVLQCSSAKEDALSKQVSDMEKNSQDLASALTEKEAMVTELRQEAEALREELTKAKTDSNATQEQAKALTADGNELRLQLRNVREELTASKTNIDRLTEDLSSAKKTISELECKKNDAIGREAKVAAELSEAKIFFERSEASLAGEVSKLEARLQVIESEKTDLKARFEEMESEKTDLKARLQEIESEKTAGLEKFNKLKKLFKDKNEVCESLNSELVLLKANHKNVVDLRNNLEAKVDDLEKQLKASQEDLDSLKNTMSSKTKAMESMSISVSENEGKLQEALSRNLGLETENKKLKETLDTTTSNSESLQKEITLTKELVDALTEDLKQAKKIIDNVNAEKVSIESEFKAFKNDFTINQDRLSTLQEDLKNLQSKEASLKADLKSKEDASSEATAEVTRLSKEIDVLKGELDSSRVAAGFLEEMLRSKDTEVKAQRETIERLKVEVGEAAQQKKAIELKNNQATEKLESVAEEAKRSLLEKQKQIEERDSRLQVLEEELENARISSEKQKETVTKYEKSVSDLEEMNAALIRDLNTAKVKLDELETAVKKASDFELTSRNHYAADLESLQSDFDRVMAEKQVLLKEVELVKQVFESEREDHSSATSGALKEVASKDSEIQRLTTLVKELKHKLKDADSLKTMVRQLEARLASKEENRDLIEEPVTAASVQVLSAARNSELAEELQQVADAKAQLERKIALMDVQHREEMEELRRQLTREREMEDVTLTSNGRRILDEKEIPSKDSQGNNVEVEDIDALKRKHKFEVRELQRLLDTVQRHSRAYKDAPIEEVVELEYLRNILYDYMMGKEPMVLAKVLAAVVKFNKDQTRNILDREAKKSSLLGQMALR